MPVYVSKAGDKQAPSKQAPGASKGTCRPVAGKELTEEVA